MKKPASLRAHLLAACPSLNNNGDRLLLFVEAGHLVSTNAPGLSFQYQYELTVILTDFGGAPESVMVPLLQWITRHQPELLAHPSTRGQIAFAADILAGDLVDLELKLQLSERVTVTREADGNLALQFRTEPPTDHGHEDTLRGGTVNGPEGVVATLPAIVDD